VIADKVGYFVLPGSQKVWDGVSGRWLTFDKPHKVPFLAFGGWVASVPKASRHKAAAWNYIMWYSNPENSLSDVVNGDSGINPYRFTHFSSIDAWTRVFSRRAAAEFLGVLKASLDSPNVALDLRLPGFNDYTQAFEEYLTRALARDMSVKDALDAVAATWEAITEQRGRAQQRALYRASIGLPPG
jgi:multiple sugar transport system substrate-binding protein